MKMKSLIRKTRKVGNSAGVLLPKKLLGSEVRVTVVRRPINLKKEALKVLNKHLNEIRGIYTTSLKDEEGKLEVLAISSKLKAVISSEKIKATIIPFQLVKKDIKTNKSLKNKIMKSSTILNQALLKELKKQL